MRRNVSVAPANKWTHYGENLAQEWDREDRAELLFDALRLAESDPTAALEQLEAMALQGSGLAAYYLGDIFVYGRFGVVKNLELAQRWLLLSANNGSVEGRYLLAQFLQGEGNMDEAILNYESLARNGFSPALFSLGIIFLKGKNVKVNIAKAKRYFEIASRHGHVHSRHWLSYIRRNRSKGVVDKFIGVYDLIMILFLFPFYKLCRPESDNFRT